MKMKSKSRNRAWGIIASVIMVLPFLLGLGGFATKASAAELAAGQANLILHKKKMLTEVKPTPNTGGEMEEFDQYQDLGDVEFKLYDATEKFYELRADGKTVTDAVEEVQDWEPTDAPIASKKTDANGTLTFEKVDKKRDGKDAVYLIVESPKAGVTPAANMVVTFPVYQLKPDGSYTDTELSKINLYPKNVVTTIGKLIVQKKGTGSSEMINGAEFIVTREIDSKIQYLSGVKTGIYSWSNNESDAIKFYTGNKYEINQNGTDVKTTETTEGNLEIYNLEVGNYKLIETKAPEYVGMITKQNVTSFEVTGKDTTAVVHGYNDTNTIMNDTSKVEKTTPNLGEDKDVQIGEAIDYQIRTNIPLGISDKTDIGAYYYTKFTLEDTHDEFLTYDGNGTLKMLDVNGKEVSIDPKNYTIKMGDNSFTVSLNSDFIPSLSAGGKLVFEYQMTLNKGANPANGFKNEVKVTTDHTRDHTETEIFTGGKRFVKVDADSKGKLPGAGFKVRNSENKYLKVDEKTDAVTWVVEADATTFTTGSDGIISIIGLKYGVYTLIETKAPEGYVLPSGDGISFTVNSKSHVLDEKTDTVFNKHKGTLPSTGGMGIVAFVAVGIVAIGGAYVYFAKGRRHIEG